MATGMISKGIKLSYKTSTTTDYVALPDLQEIPDVGGEADNVEVTTLDDAAKRYVAGIKDYGNLEFTFLYDNSSNTSSYRVLRGLEDAGTIADFKITLPDTTEFAFSGSVSTTIAGAGVGDALTFKAKVTLNTDISVTNPTA